MHSPRPLPEVLSLREMAQLGDRDQAESPGFELEEIGRSIRSSFRLPGSISPRSSIGSARVRGDDDEYELQWAAIERLSTFERVRKSVLEPSGSGGREEKKVVDVTKLGALERRLLIEKLIKHIENDNLQLPLCLFSSFQGQPRASETSEQATARFN